ncbi:MAG: hypothetical protein IJE60_07735 [Tyzzerella sp.]|nr:hypothetical protein [Tyzzerella sp.]
MNLKNHNYNIKQLEGKWKLFMVPHEQFVNEEHNYYTLEQLQDSKLLCVDCSVPGNFELDLQKAGIIDDPFFSTNVLELQKYEEHHLWYACQFEAETTKDAWLRFEGVDTYAEIYLNGSVIGKTDNMLVEFDFPATGLCAGINELVVHIRPASVEARKYDVGINPSQSYRQDSLWVRKAPHMYGWDIMPRVLSGGIWKPVYLYQLPKERIDNFFIQTFDCSDEKAELRAWYDTTVCHSLYGQYELRISGCCGDSTFCCTHQIRHATGYVPFSIREPKLWWPRYMGEPNLYEVKVELVHGDVVVDQYQTAVGIRTVRLNRTSIIEPDGSGEFCFYINEKPFFAMGTNWVQLDAFHSRDAERLPQALEMTKDIGCNMVRCWGGNVYESDEFYDFCDRNGIAVWQDFSMACSTYPQDREFCDILYEEAKKVILRLRQHPSLIVWAGDNECDESRAVSGLQLNPNDNVLTRKILPSVLIKYDPMRLYLPSSPYMDEYAVAQKKIRKTTENHLWGPRDYYKGKFYTDTICCFASETGYHGCPSVESIKKFISEEYLWPHQNNPEWLVHASGYDLDPNGPYAYRIPLMANQIKVLFGRDAESLEEFSKLSQISQAEAFKFFIERFRIRKGQRTGILWWNLLDGWPQFSDAVVDYYYEKKLAYDVIKRSQQPVCLMMDEPENGTIALFGVNEYQRDVIVNYTVYDVEQEEPICSSSIVLPASSSMKVATIACNMEELHCYRIEWGYDVDKTGWNHYLCGNIPFADERCVALLQKAGVTV